MTPDWQQLKPCCIHNRLPRSLGPTPTCGKILLHAKRQVSAFRESMGISLCIFKIGVTANPAERFMDYLLRNFSSMWVIFQGDDLGLIHMLEAALISEFQLATGCKNAPNSGGEGGLNRKRHLGPPYFVYVTGGRGDQAKWVGWLRWHSHPKKKKKCFFWGGGLNVFFCPKASHSSAPCTAMPIILSSQVRRSS